MICFIGMDDTDNLESRGTGRLARQTAACLSGEFKILGVVRHQLLFDPRVPYTKNNSSATIILEAPADVDVNALFTHVKGCMLADFQDGSDPGLCMLAGDAPPEIIEFGRRVQRELVSQDEARQLAGRFGLLLEGLGGTQGGVIGALAAVGLSASGKDEHYVEIGSLRSLSGLQPVSAVLAAGVDQLRTLTGEPITSGSILTNKLRPARRQGRPIAYLQWSEDHWQPVKLD
jgi:tRNA(Ile2) C34 agmatinyltransferase TiaS